MLVSLQIQVQVLGTKSHVSGLQSESHVSDRGQEVAWAYAQRQQTCLFFLELAPASAHVLKFLPPVLPVYLLLPFPPYPSTYLLPPLHATVLKSRQQPGLPFWKPACFFWEWLDFRVASQVHIMGVLSPSQV